MKNITPWIAWRYIFSRKIGHFGPLLTVVAMASIAIGMLSIISVMSVMRGFKAELTDRLLGFNAHITVTKTSDDAPAVLTEDIRRMLSGKSVRDVAPFVQGEVIVKSISTGELLAQGARIRGVDSGRLGAMEGLEFYFPEGENVLSGRDNLSGGAIIGNDMVMQLAVHPSFNDSIEIIAPLANVGPSGELEPNRKKFAVIGLFHAGIYDYDAKYILLTIDDARRLLGQQAEEGWQIRLDDIASVPAVLAGFKEVFPEGWEATGWHDQNKKLFSALKLERIAMGAILVMALLIASFSIGGVVFLITAAKRKDIAILQSVGMKSGDIMRIFLLGATYIGAVGSAIGLVGGMVLCFAVEIWPLRLPDSYYLDYLPVDLNPLVAVLFSVLGVGIAVVSAIYPVRQAMKTSVVDVLRYE